LKNLFPEKFRGKFRGKSLSAEKNVRKIGPSIIFVEKFVDFWLKAQSTFCNIGRQKDHNNGFQEQRRKNGKNCQK
jgi:hypothetical protein